MKRAPILFQIGGLALLIVLAVQAISVSVVLMTPPPVPPRMSPATVREALLDPAVARAEGWRRTVSSAAPFETTPGAGGMIAAGLAAAMERHVDDVRVRTAPAAPERETQSSVSVFVRQPADGEAVALAPASAAVDIDRLTGAVTLFPQFTLPAFETALRGEDGRWVVVGPPDRPWARWALRLGLMLVVSLMVLAPVVWWAARRLTLPVRALAEAARAADLDGAHAAFPVNGPREVVAVAEALAAMRDRLGAQVDERMRILAAVAHDLRTPLTGLRLRAETAPPVERDRMAADIARMEAMIADVLAFSTDAQWQGQVQVVDLAAVCADCVDDAIARGGQVDCAAMERVMVKADPARVRRVILNLVDNSVRYAGSAEVTLGVHDGRAQVRIADRGPGVSSDQIAAVFQPFYRLEPSRNQHTGGVGLGLTIARNLARADSGEVDLIPRPGGGLEVRLSYPVARRETAGADLRRS